MDGFQISEILIKRNRKICTSADIKDIAKEKYLLMISGLLNTGWVRRVVGFRGVYYVLDAEERQSKTLKLGSFQILIDVLNAKFKSGWYFGRLTAAGLTGLIHQPVSTYYVINRSMSRTIDSKLFGKVVLIKISAGSGKSCGISKQAYRGVPYNVSSTERNVADYLYLYTHGHGDIDQISSLHATSYGNKEAIGKEALLEIIFRCYPKASAIKMAAVLRRMSK